MITRIHVNAEKILGSHNVLSAQDWECEPIARDDIVNAIANNRFERTPFNLIKDGPEPPTGWRQYHIGRIAYLATSPIDDESGEHQISVRLDRTDADNPIFVNEGRHRIVAASFRTDKRIFVSAVYIDEEDLEIVK